MESKNLNSKCNRLTNLNIFIVGMSEKSTNKKLFQDQQLSQKKQIIFILHYIHVI